ncbi:alpha/beta hydrolase [Novosphingobium sp. PhB165]|uniref:alpha/beta hydrolase family protein n=1 Tax=Novosphingobium sp. PhB165 TaxID=2485105 RepID=UPI0014043B7E|nr:alpha/beta hydrolase [Novosphingobium sp. PhB165]
MTSILRTRPRTAVLVAALTLGSSGVGTLPASAQAPAAAASASPKATKTTFVSLGMGVPAVLYEPVNPGPKAQIAFFVMHASADYLTFSACSELSKRGYRVLCANNSTDKASTFNDGLMDDVLLQAKQGVAYLRRLPGVSKVVLFGHSGGATTMTAYQAIAENGPAFCQDAAKLHKCSDALAGLPPADGIVLADANWGQAAMVLFSIDPAVRDEANGQDLDPPLDMYNLANGYNPQGTHFSPDFVHRFLAAQGARANAIIGRAEKRLAAIDAGQGTLADDELFLVPGGSVVANKLFPADTSLLSHTVKPWPLVHSDGTVTTQIVHSVRVPSGGPMGLMPSNTYRAALKTTVKNYLSSWAIRVTDDYGYGEDSTIHGVDWHSTYAAPPGNVEGITVPFLTLGMTGNWEGMAAETIYGHAKSRDKSIAFIEGATHMYTTCRRCESTPGQFGDTLKTTYDFIDGWASKPGRFQ